jgi:hypothetical protein
VWIEGGREMKRPEIERHHVDEWCANVCFSEEVEALEAYADKVAAERDDLRRALKYTLDRLREYNVFIPEYLKLTRIDKDGE